MKEYDETTYGQRISEVYDELYPDYDPASIKLLAELARSGPALELGIGSGRITLTLREKGITVWGIDASEAMLSKLSAKTVSNYVSNILNKLQVADRAQAIVKARSAGLGMI